MYFKGCVTQYLYPTVHVGHVLAWIMANVELLTDKHRSDFGTEFFTGVSLCSKTVNHASVQTVFVARPMAEFMEHGGIVFIQCIELFTQGHGYTVISRTVIGPVSRLMCNIGTRSYDKVFRPLQWIP